MDLYDARDAIALWDSRLEFPPVHAAREDGLLAVGGELSPQRLLLAYREGIFPWFKSGGLIYWWSPDPRMVLFPNRLKISKSMRKLVRDRTFSLSRDQCFDRVIEQCARVRRKGEVGDRKSTRLDSSH